MSEPENHLRDDANSRRQARLTQRLIRKTSGVIETNLRMVDYDGNGHLSAAEGMSLVDISIVKVDEPDAPQSRTERPSTGAQLLPNYEIIATSSVVDDTVILDREKLTTALSEKYELTPERIDRLISKAFPNGITPVTTGTLCAANPQLQCTPLPNGKVVHFKNPPTRT